MRLSSDAGPRLWGDGFDGDGFRELYALSEWELCSPDELIRFFPNLPRMVSPVPKLILDRVRACVADPARERLSRDRRSRPLAAAEANPHPFAVRASAVESRPWWDLRRKRRPDAAERLERDRHAHISIAEIAVELASGSLRPFDAVTAAEFVYRTGVHPVYLWPEALLTHELYTAIGWIGQAERHRRALMTVDIAEYFSSTLICDPAGTFRSVEPLLLPYIASFKVARSIVKSAKSRLTGRRPIARLRPPCRGGLAVYAGA